MSFEALNFALNVPVETLPNPAARHVLLIIASYADADGYCYPSRRRIAEKTGLSTRSIGNQLNTLETLALIDRIARRFKDKQSTNLYRVNYDKNQREPFSPWIEKAEGTSFPIQRENNDNSDEKQRERSSHNESFKVVLRESLEKEFKALSISEKSSEVFSYWKTVMNKPTAKFTKERKDRVIARLTPKPGDVDGYTVEQIKLAIDGCKSSPHNQGENERGTKYDDLELICRSGTNLERFMFMVSDRPARRRGGDTFPIAADVDDPRSFAAPEYRRPSMATPADIAIWEKLLIAIENNIRPEFFRSWFSDLIIDGIDANARTFNVRTAEITAEWIRRYYQANVDYALASIGFEGYSLKWEIEQTNFVSITEQITPAGVEHRPN